MYPETDLPLLKISRQMIDGAKKTLPSLKEVETKVEGLNQEMAALLLKRNKIEEFKEFMHIIKNPKLIAKILLLYPPEIATKEKKTLEQIEKILNRDILANVLEDVNKKKIHEGEVKHLLERIVKGESSKIEKIDESEIEEKIMKIIKEKPGLSENAYMGLVMKEFHGKVSGKEASEMIRKHLK